MGIEVYDAFDGSDAEKTKALYARLEQMAPRGPIAMNLLRTLKASGRAKVYKGGQRGRGSYRSMAYDKKDWSIGELVDALKAHGDEVKVEWGWGYDNKAIGFENVLYVDLPGCGQVSFHTGYRRDGPDYAKPWDGVVGSARARVCAWAQAVLEGRDCQMEKSDVKGDRSSREAAAGDEGGEVRGGAEAEPRFDL